jgi:hypothetical protein
MNQQSISNAQTFVHTRRANQQSKRMAPRETQEIKELPIEEEAADMPEEENPTGLLEEDNEEG